MPTGGESWPEYPALGSCSPRRPNKKAAALPSRLLDSTPKTDGFHMPAEWELHERCYLVWPERTDNWRVEAGPAQSAFTAVAEAIARSEPVTMLASSAQWERARAACSPAVQVVETTTDDAWARDIGPTFVVNRGQGERRGVDWIFNAWGGLDGGLYHPWDNDDLVAAKVCDLEGAARYRAPFVLEGGAIHVDGEGTCITTEECLLNPNRNPGLSRAEIEAQLAEYLGIDTVIWIPRGVVGDETNGHVDNLACFSRPGRVLLTWTEAADDPQSAISREARRSPGVGHRCPGPPPRRRAAAVARAALDHGRRSDGREQQRPRRRALSRGPDGGLVRQLLSGQHGGRPPPPRPPP